MGDCALKTVRPKASLCLRQKQTPSLVDGVSFLQTERMRTPLCESRARRMGFAFEPQSASSSLVSGKAIILSEGKRPSACTKKHTKRCFVCFLFGNCSLVVDRDGEEEDADGEQKQKELELPGPFEPFAVGDVCHREADEQDGVGG